MAENLIEIDLIKKDEYLRFKEIRIRSLKEDPNAFGTTAEQALSWPIESWISQTSNIPTFIAKEGLIDLGVVRVASDQENVNVVWIISMWVDQKGRGKGIGKKLLEEAILWSKRNGYSLIKLDVADFNTAAIKLYEKMGFKNNGIVGSLPAPRAHIAEHQKEFVIKNINS
jgi:ribosomal protein S18 acetylase RimI-like enzyme